MSAAHEQGSTPTGVTTITQHEATQVARANATGLPPVVFVHGLWLLPSSWDRWAKVFEAAGFTALTPGWPDDPDSVEEGNVHPAVFAHKSIGQVADHFDEIIRGLTRKPAIIGHSFGGLLAQILAGRGLASATVAIPELAALHRTFELARGGHGQLALIVGASGIGKTALTRRCLSTWLPQTVSVSGDPGETSLAGGLLDQLAQSATVPEAGQLAGLLAAGGVSPLSAGSALLLVFQAMAAVRPLVVVIDDAQWVDEVSLRALSFALRRLRSDPVLCIVLARPEDLGRLPDGLLRVVTDRGLRLDLGGLNPAEVTALAELVGAGPLGHRAAQRLREHAAGIPLHVKELLQDLPGDLLRAPGVTLPAPRSLAALVLARLAACTPQTERLVVAAAILGPDCQLTDAAQLAGLDDPLPALQEASQQRLLLDRAAAGGRQCAFPHALLRAAVYRDIGVSRRAALHRTAAGLTSGSAALGHRAAGCRGDDPILADDLDTQAATELAAGLQAEAAEHLLTAVRVDERGPRRDGRLLTAVGMLIDLGDAAHAHIYAAEVAAGPASAARSVTLARLAMLTGDYGPAERWLMQAWAAAPGSALPVAAQARQGAAAAACELAFMLLGQHRSDDAAGWAQRAADTGATRLTRACSRAVRGGSLALAGQAQQARVVLETELARGEEGLGQTLIRASLGALLLDGDDLDGATAQLDAAVAGGTPACPLLTCLRPACCGSASTTAGERGIGPPPRPSAW